MAAAVLPCCSLQPLSPPQTDQYFKAHTPSLLVRLLRCVAIWWANVIDAYLTPAQLNRKLSSFNIQACISGPLQSSKILSDYAQNLLQTTFRNFQGKSIVDVHMHVLGYDQSNYVRPPRHFFERVKFAVIHIAAGIFNPRGSTEVAANRLLAYVNHFPNMVGVVLPIHEARNKAGVIDWNSTASHLTNQVAHDTAQKSSQLRAAVSIHPADPNAIEKLVSAHARGVRIVKWMPPQGIDPSDSHYIPFYAKMAELKMILLAHGGPEHSFPTKPEWQVWGNPLCFKLPLQQGVDVILAHCGHDDLMHNEQGQSVKGYELFLQLAEQAHKEGWKGKLYGDLSGIINHSSPDMVQRLLRAQDAPGVNLVYGSDAPYTSIVNRDPYPEFAKRKMLRPEHASSLKEIRNWNPLVANFMLAHLLGFKRDTFTQLAERV